MRKILILLVFATLILPSAAIAEKPKHGVVRLGLFLDQKSAKLCGPQWVLLCYSEPRIAPFNDRLGIEALGFYVGLRLEKWKLTPGILLDFLWGWSEPVDSLLNLGNLEALLSAWELSLRYALLERKYLSLYMVGSLGRFHPIEEKGGRGYGFWPFFLPGLGVGANVSILHTEVRFHKWLASVVGDADETAPEEWPHPSWPYTIRRKPLRLA